MSKDVMQILAELRLDHRNMALLLNLLEREANRLYDGEEPDYDLMHDVMQYMTIYPDAVHHPKEDLLYAELKAARPDLSAGFEKIRNDHRDIAELGTRARDDLASIASDAFVNRKTIVADALRYVNTLRDHMRWEDTDLFRRCEEMAAAGHDLVVDSTLVGRGDPLFGEEAQARFSNLLKGIEAALQADRT